LVLQDSRGLLGKRLESETRMAARNVPDSSCPDETQRQGELAGAESRGRIARLHVTTRLDFVEKLPAQLGSPARELFVDGVPDLCLVQKATRVLNSGCEPLGSVASMSRAVISLAGASRAVCGVVALAVFVESESPINCAKTWMALLTFIVPAAPTRPALRATSASSRPRT
jgi:hypothetical protein